MALISDHAINSDGFGLTFRVNSRSIAQARPDYRIHDVIWLITTTDHAMRYLFCAIPAEDRHKYGSLFNFDSGDYVDVEFPLAFTTVPPGDWNAAQLSPRPEDCKLILTSTEKRTFTNEETFDTVTDRTIELSGLDQAWAFTDDYAAYDSDPQLGDQAWAGRKCSDAFSEMYLEGKAGIAFFDDAIGDPGDIVFNECRAQSILHGHGVTPRVLAYLTLHHSRIVGWVLEHLPAARVPTLADLAECQAVLARLHSFGLNYGANWIRKWSFIILPSDSGGNGSRALLRDFTATRPCDDKATFAKEIAKVEAVLADTGRGDFGLFEDPLEETWEAT